MEYAQILCFLGEIYRDNEQGPEAIDALSRAVRMHEQTSENQFGLASQVSGVSNVGKD